MLWPKKNSYKEFGNEKEFLRLENSPPITFLMVRPLGTRKCTVAHRGHGTYIFISRDKKTVYRAINWELSRDNLDLSRNNSQFIARYKNVRTVSSMGHRRNGLFTAIPEIRLKLHI